MKRITYLIPPSLLEQAGRVLQPAEQVRFVTGIKRGRIIILTQLVAVKAVRSLVGARPDPASVARLQERLRAIGMDIEAQFHSHPGLGPDATHPSRIDLHMARRWENGAPFLGGIFSADGQYVRFFNHQQHSEIIIYGSPYEQLTDHLFALRGNAPVSATTSPAREADGPSGAGPVVETNTY